MSQQIAARAQTRRGLVGTTRLLALLVTVAVSGFLADACAVVPAQFGAATNFPTGASPGGIVVGDFNRDGKPDVAVTVGTSVSVLLNLGNGMLAAPITIPAHTYAQGNITLGDFNNDAVLDIVLAASMDFGGCILFGDGSGNFPASTNLAYSNYASSVTAGDFNGDGNLDLAFGSSRDYITVAFGRGDGSFGLHTNYTLASGNYIYDVRAGDIYRNGRLALVVSTDSGANSNSFCVLSNKGDGTFAAQQYYAAGGRYESHDSLELGDFNGDGALDVAVLNHDAESVTIWLNSGSGVFAPAHEYTVGFSLTSIAQGDFNGDGRIDLELIRK